MHILANVREAFGFENVMFFTPGSVTVSSVARRVPSLLPRADNSQRLTASRCLAFKNAGDVSRAAASCHKSVPQNRLNRASEWLRQVIVGTMNLTCPHLAVRFKYFHSRVSETAIGFRRRKKH